ncbi:hypothetical protein CRENBAI_007951, partial [Crenichthys baileyi]
MLAAVIIYGSWKKQDSRDLKLVVDWRPGEVRKPGRDGKEDGGGGAEEGRAQLTGEEIHGRRSLKAERQR